LVNSGLFGLGPKKAISPLMILNIGIATSTVLAIGIYTTFGEFFYWNKIIVFYRGGLHLRI
jgi:hypothetical protein